METSKDYVDDPTISKRCEKERTCLVVDRGISSYTVSERAYNSKVSRLQAVLKLP